jgi:hypothetical protein
MKKLLLAFLAFGLVFSACKKDDDAGDAGLSPSQTQNGFAINYTATWCGHCGDWGAPLIHDYADAAPNGVAICAHGSNDPMNNSLYSSFSSDRTTGGGIPSFWVGDEKTTSGGAMTALLGQAATAGVDYDYSVEGTTMTVNTKTKFFAAGTGQYYLSVLVLEDGIDGSSSAGSYAQGGTSNSYPNDDYKHDFVLRAAATSGNAYGELISTDPAKDSEVDKTYTITLDATWKNPYAVCIIWKYDASSGAPEFKYINALKKKM